MTQKYISWRRVSTFKQGQSGLGLEAQKEIIRYFIERDKGDWIADYSECYTGKELSGCVELQKAMQHAKREGAILVIAKSDRFRNCQEALGILTEMGEGNIQFCDLPHSDRFTLTLFWALAEREALITSIRTKQALAAKKARGEKVGGACLKWKQAFLNKTQKEKEEIQLKKGESKRTRFQESRDVQTFKEILRREFPKQTKDEDPKNWRWAQITCRQPHLDNMLNRMQEYKMIDNTLFAKWNFNFDCDQKLRNYLHTLQRSYNRNQD